MNERVDLMSELVVEERVELPFSGLVDEIGEKLKGPISDEEYRRGRDQWQGGELSSWAFFPLVLKTIFGLNIRLREEGLDFPSEPQETIWERVKTDHILKESFLLGLNGKNPPFEKLSQFSSFLEGFKPKREPGGQDLTRLNIKELEKIDDQLPPSLLVNMWFFDWMGGREIGKRAKENVVFEHYRKAVREALKTENSEMVDPWLRWILLEYAIGTANKFATQTVISYYQQAASLLMTTFPNMEAFLRGSKIPVAFYYLGWVSRLVVRLHPIKSQLFKDDEAGYKIMRQTIFLRLNKGKTGAIKRVLERWATGDYQGAKEVLVEICAKHQERSPLPQWAREELGIEDEAIQSLRGELEKERQRKMKEGARKGGQASAAVAEQRRRAREEEEKASLVQLEGFIDQQLEQKFPQIDRQGEIELVIRPTNRSPMYSPEPDESDTEIVRIVKGRLVCGSSRGGRLVLEGWGIIPSVVLRHLKEGNCEIVEAKPVRPKV